MAALSHLALITALWPVAAGLAVAAQPASEADHGEAFTIERLSEGVHLLRPAAQRLDLTNALVIERRDGLLVVESQPSPEAARELLSALRRIRAQPIRYLVLSHAHAESAGGASAFPESTLVVGSKETSRLLADPRFDFGAELRARERRGWKRPEIRAPVLVVHARTELTGPRIPVELLPLSQAHSPGDLLVSLPEQKILYAGALLFVDRNPFALHADIEGWLGALNHIVKIAPAIVVPLRGPPVDLRSVRAQRDGLAWLRGQAELGLIEGVDPERLGERILRTEEARRHFDLEASPPFARTLIDKAVEEALARRRKHGLR
jgi:glyoxylase-like metal-dependent hydrolase (beta-lactamase superfamily II)